MDIVEATNEFQDWELLQTNSDTESTPVTTADSGISFHEINSGGLIQANYFSSEPQDRCEELVDDGKSVVSDNPGWIDPNLEEDRRPNKESGEFWPDSSSERSDDQKLSELEVSNELGFVNEEKYAKFEAIEDKEGETQHLGKCCMDSSGIDGDSAEISDVAEESQVLGKEMNKDKADLGNYCMDSGGIDGDSAEISDIEKESQVLGEEMNEDTADSGNYCTDSGEIDVDSAEIIDFAEEPQAQAAVNLHVESQVLGDEMNENEGIESGVEAGDAAGVKNGGELEKGGVVWWKMPMEFLKYCMMRMSPVWTVSVAAAFMGFVILGRRLYKMKKKSRGLQIKVAVDDKKASQVMSRAARLNEAFSVVKLVPVIRPSLPAVGSTGSWPVMSLR